MPYLMGGFPDLEASRAIGEAYADGGADLVELGVPFSDPLADGPVIHAAGTRALAAGATVPAVIELARALAERLPVVLMCYANLVLARGVERFADELATRRCQRSDHSGPPARGGAGGARGVRRGRARARPAGRADDARGAAGADRRPGPRLHLRGLGDRHDRRASGARRRRAARARQARTREVPVALGFGIATPEQAAAAAAAGADGVIVGSRLVRAAAEGEDVRALVAGLAAALAGRRVRSRRDGARSSPPAPGWSLWIVLWAVDVKSFDAFLLTLGMVILAATVRIVAPYLPGNRPGPISSSPAGARLRRTAGYGADCHSDRSPA